VCSDPGAIPFRDGFPGAYELRRARAANFPLPIDIPAGRCFVRSVEENEVLQNSGRIGAASGNRRLSRWIGDFQAGCCVLGRTVRGAGTWTCQVTARMILRFLLLVVTEPQKQLL
jgi:hypothetical protein